MITYLVSYSCSSNQCWRHFEGLLLIILPILMKNYSAVHQKCPTWCTCRCHWQECKNPTLFETKMAKVDALFLTKMAKKSIHVCSLCSHHVRNMNGRETGQQSLFLIIEFKVATLLVKCFKLGKIHVIDSSENQALTSYWDQQWNSSVQKAHIWQWECL